MKRFGLLGQKLSHSYSPQIHAKLADYEYKLYEKEPEEVAPFFENFPLDGINVTIPYKKTVMPFCAKLSETALKIGSVNTIVRGGDGTLSGHNTDYFGFLHMLCRGGIDRLVKGEKVVVLGSGGSSLTVTAVLRDLSAREIVVVSRSGNAVDHTTAGSYDNIDKHFDAGVIVNTTPVGMFPNVDSRPVDLTCFERCSGVADLIYNPAKTLLLQQAGTLGIKHINGLSMLVAQAKRAAEIFLDKEIDDKIIDEICGGKFER